MTEAEFDPLTSVKSVLVMHLLRQQIEADLAVLKQSQSLRLSDCYLNWLERLHGRLLSLISERKRELRRHRVRIVKQQKNRLDFQIAYLYQGYEIQHCFLLATLYAEAQELFTRYLEGGLYERS
jgi:hypothetical protein